MTKKFIKEIDSKFNYLSEIYSELPSHVLFNKGITGCGGTTVELTSNRDSIILVPTKNLVYNKQSNKIFGVTGKTTNISIINYINSYKGYKKIIATYDSLPRLIELIPDYYNYFLLIDEYHLLFNDYTFRSDAVLGILKNYTKFKDWCFMTATPLNENCILKELEDIPQIIIKWKAATKVNMLVCDTPFTQKLLGNIITNTLSSNTITTDISNIEDLLNLFKSSNVNLHIFLNSLKTIENLVKKYNISEYRVVCSENHKGKVLNYASVNSSVKHINFYTSCSFEGVDIIDENGLCIILSDTNISTSVLDISTKVRQICGRLRNSKFKEYCFFIFNSRKHRYAGTDYEKFIAQVNDSERRGRRRAELIANESEDDKITDLKLFNPETYYTIYLNKYKDNIFYDENLKKLDIYNYQLISEIYNNTISVVKESEKHFNIINKSITEQSTYSFIKEFITEKQYPYIEFLEQLKQIGLKHNVKITRQNLKTILPEFIIKQIQVNHVRKSYIIFK